MNSPLHVSPEVGLSVYTNGLCTNYHDTGTGSPVLLLHGGGPGVSAYTNWKLLMSALSQHRRVLAPDMAGFGFTERKPGVIYTLDNWLAQAVAFLDALDLPEVDVVGNAFGGSLAIALAIRHPHRVRRLVVTGGAGVSSPITPALDAAWGYEPSLENMRRMMNLFVFDHGLVDDNLVRQRFEASVRPGVQESFASMFPAPRQRWVDALASREADIAVLPHETLLIHGREDHVLPLENSLRLNQLIPRAQLHVFGRCGHLAHAEYPSRFAKLVENFLAEGDRES